MPRFPLPAIYFIILEMKDAKQNGCRAKMILASRKLLRLPVPKSAILSLITAFCFISSPANSQQSYNVQIHFHHFVGEQSLQLDSIYQNKLNESFSVRKFRYYISNIRFYDTLKNLNYLAKNKYFLVDENNPESKIIALNIPAGSYQKISFLIGVDSIRNVSGAQTGALDPLNDMFWTWRSGYVMAKLEGTSPVSTLPRRMFEYHIGGFSGANNVLRSTDLHLSLGIGIKGNKSTVINISVDLNAWFSAVHHLPITNSPACTAPGDQARKYAENSAQMFSIQASTPE